MAFDQNKYNTEYRRDHYDKVKIRMSKNKYAKVKNLSIELGISVSQLIIRALEKTYLLDLTGDFE